MCVYCHIHKSGPISYRFFIFQYFLWAVLNPHLLLTTLRLIPIWNLIWREITPSHHIILKGHWGTTDDFTASFHHVFLFSTALWDLTNSRPVHLLKLSSHLFLCLPCPLPPFTMPCKIVLARSDEWGTCSYDFSLCLIMMVMRFLCGLIACWILAQTSSTLLYAL